MEAQRRVNQLTGTSKWEKAIDLSLMRASSLEEQLCWGKGVSNLKGCRESCLVDISGDAILVPKAYGLLP